MISCDQGEPAEEMATTTIAMTAASKLVPEVLMDTSLISSKRCRTLTGGCRILPGSDEPPRYRRHRARQLSTPGNGLAPRARRRMALCAMYGRRPRCKRNLTFPRMVG